MKKEKTIMILLDHDLKIKINNQAHDERVTMSELIRRVMADYVALKNGVNDER